MGDVGEYGFDWEDVDNPIPSPLDSLCALRVKTGAQFEHRGTASLLGNRILLTAAHAVDIGQNRVAAGVSWALDPAQFYVVNGLNKGNAIATKWIDRIAVPVEFPHSGSRYDLAILRLKGQISSSSALTPTSLDAPGKFPIAVPGYPSHWDPKIADGDDIRVGLGSGGVLPPKPDLLAYSADTFSGHSGAPVFIGNKSNPFAGYIGIHSDEGSTLYNVGVRFTADSLNWIEETAAALLQS